MAEAVMARFDALAFDDLTAYDHAWTLDEIRADTTFDELRYFDYRGYHERSQRRAAEHGGDGSAS